MLGGDLVTLTIPSARGWMAFIGWSFLASGAAQGGIFDSSVRKVQVGHWLEIKGELTDDLFVASWVELRAPERYEIIIGTAEQIEASSGEFALLHQAIQESEENRLGGHRQERGGREASQSGRLLSRIESIRGAGGGTPRLRTGSTRGEGGRDNQHQRGSGSSSDVLPRTLAARAIARA